MNCRQIHNFYSKMGRLSEDVRDPGQKEEDEPRHF